MIVTRYLEMNPYFNDGKWIEGRAFRGFVLHSVGCAQPEPLVFWKAWNRPSYTNAGISGFIGADVTYITAPCLDTPGRVKRMPHAGKSAGNNGYIGFEMCEPASLRYGAGATFTCTDRAAAQAFCRRVYGNAVELFAKLCAFHGKNPLEPGVIYSHNELGQKGLGSGHVDPEHLWRGLGLGYTMAGFRKDVYEKMHAKEEIEMTKQELLELIDARIDARLEGKDTVVSNWAKEELAQAMATGITDGTRPMGYATRQEVACMTLRAMKKA